MQKSTAAGSILLCRFLCCLKHSWHFNVRVQATEPSPGFLIFSSSAFVDTNKTVSEKQKPTTAKKIEPAISQKGIFHCKDWKYIKRKMKDRVFKYHVIPQLFNLLSFVRVLLLTLHSVMLSP